MNLLCPNCQKLLQVPDQFAGQLMKCPLCTGTFTVPVLPSAPPPPPPVPASPGPPPAPSAPEERFTEAPPPPAGYGHVRTLTLNRTLVSLVAPLALLVIFILLFFPWVQLSPGGDTVAGQSGWQVAVGSMDVDNDTFREWVKAFRENRPEAAFNTESLSPDWHWSTGLPILLFLLVYFVAAAVAVLSLAMTFTAVNLPAGLADFVPFRSLLLAGLGVLAWTALLLQGLVGFELESKAKEVALSLVPQLPQDATDSEKRVANFRYTQNLAMFGVHTTCWFRGTLWLLVLAIAGALLDFWLTQRGGRPLPRLQLLT
jgi:hypothetical protein